MAPSGLVMHCPILVSVALPRVNYDSHSMIHIYIYDLEGCHGTPTIGCAINKMIELETDITAKLLELSRYATNGNNYSKIDGDLYPENDILVDPTTCEAPHIDDFIIANYLSEQREVKLEIFRSYAFFVTL